MFYMRFNLFSIGVFIILFGLTPEHAEANLQSVVPIPIQSSNLHDQAHSPSPADADTATTAEYLLYELAPAARKSRNLNGALAAGVCVLSLIDGIESSGGSSGLPRPFQSSKLFLSGFLAVSSAAIFIFPSPPESAAEEIREISDPREREEAALEHLIAFSERARKLRMNVGGMLLTIGLLGFNAIIEDRQRGHSSEPGMGLFSLAMTGGGLYRLLTRYPEEKIMERYERAHQNPGMTIDLCPALIPGERRMIPGVSARLSFGRYGPSR